MDSSLNRADSEIRRKGMSAAILYWVTNNVGQGSNRYFCPNRARVHYFNSEIHVCSPPIKIPFNHDQVYGDIDGKDHDPTISASCPSY